MRATREQLENAVWTETWGVGKIGRAGTETHAITCEVTTINEGQPWADKLVRKAHTLCSSGRIGYRSPHSIRFEHPTRQNVTCENCRSFTGWIKDTA